MTIRYTPTGKVVNQPLAPPARPSAVVVTQEEALKANIPISQPFPQQRNIPIGYEQLPDGSVNAYYATIPADTPTLPSQKRTIKYSKRKPASSKKKKKTTKKSVASSKTNRKK